MSNPIAEAERLISAMRICKSVRSFDMLWDSLARAVGTACPPDVKRGGQRMRDNIEKGLPADQGVDILIDRTRGVSIMCAEEVPTQRLATPSSPQTVGPELLERFKQLERLAGMPAGTAQQAYAAAVNNPDLFARVGAEVQKLKAAGPVNAEALSKIVDKYEGEFAKAVNIPQKPAAISELQEYASNFKSIMKEQYQMAPKKKPVEVVRAEMDVQEVIVPKGMKLSDAREWLARKEDEENQRVDLHEVVTGFPMDAAYALAKALHNRYRIAGTETVIEQGMFGPEESRPRMVQLQLSEGEKVEVPWGRLSVPQWEGGYLETGFTKDKKGNRALKVTGIVKRRLKEEVLAIVDSARALMKTESLLKGAAFTIDFDALNQGDPGDGLPEFIQLKGIREEDLIFPDQIMRTVKQSLFTPVERTEECRKHGIPLRRGVLLEGPYGVGKTLTANVLAKKAKENGWTYLYVKDIDQLAEALQFARQYQPAIVFCEDVDEILGTQERSEAVNDVLNTLDGVDGKNTEILTVLTSNHADRLNAALLRPGRLDTVVPVRAPDEAAAVRLMRSYGKGLLDPSADLASVAKVLAGHIPAVIREAIERAKLAAISHIAPGMPFTLVTRDLMDAAHGMVAQVEACRRKEAPPTNVADQFVKQIAESTYQALKSNGMGATLQTIKDQVDEIHGSTV